jgi:hypothetical protein
MLQHDVLGRINDYNFALNISVCLVLVESTSNQQEEPSAYEDGTDRVFRNVGNYKSDAGESPKRRHTIRSTLQSPTKKYQLQCTQ